MTLDEAYVSCGEGNFVTNTYLSSYESMHFYNGNFYYEDGAKISGGTFDLSAEDFAKGDSWSLKMPKERIDLEKLKTMHESARGMMLSGKSYEDCFIK